MGHFSEQNFYEILEVAPNATSEEIQKAFFKAKSTYSPASTALYSVFSESEAQELLKMIDEAYAVLSNTAKRREYDQSVLGRASTSAAAPVAEVKPKEKNISSNTSDMLPDFMLPQETVAPAKTAAETKPHLTVVAKKNTGRTIVSHYNVDPEFEKEILAQEVFDGTFLQKVRLYKGISVDQLAEISRISRPYILAVETNDFHSLPAAVYVRGFIASVAKLLGMDERKVVTSYMKLFKDSRSD